jgi:hypothetical protein
VLPGADTTTGTGGEARYDFGEVSVFDKPTAVHVFRLKNDTSAPVTISRLLTSCGCTGAVLNAPARGAAAAAPAPAPPGAGAGALATLEPGQETEVQVVLKLADLKPGRIRKSASVLVAGQNKPAARLEMSGTILPSVRLEPAVNDLGAIPAGKGRSFRVTAIMDARVAADGPVPDLSADNPSLRVTPVRAAAPAPAQTPGTITKTYEVTVAPDAPLGTLSARIVFAIPPVGAAAQVAAAAAAPQAPAPTVVNAPTPAGTAPALSRRVLNVLSNVAATVEAEVTGDLTAEPQMVAFGAAREQATRTVTLTGKTASAITGLKLETVEPNPFIAARLLDPEPGQGQTRTLEVTLNPSGAPVGVQSSRLKATLANGQRMEIPVNAYILPPEPDR